MIKKYIKWVILFITVVIFMAIAQIVAKDEIIFFDEVIYNWISQWINPVTTQIFKGITYFGSVIPILVITISILLIVKNRQYGKYVVINLIIAVIGNQLLKRIFQRPRPTINRLVEESGFSFPSGHSMVSMAFYGLLIYFAYKKIENKPLKYIITTLLTILVIAIGISRIYLGVHYASDVIGGFCISIAYLILFINLGCQGGRFSLTIFFSFIL